MYTAAGFLSSALAGPLAAMLGAMTSAWNQEAAGVAAGIRRRVLAHVLRNGGGYMSQACSSAEILATLYTRVLKLGPSDAPAVPPAFSGVPSASNLSPWRGGQYNGPRAPNLDRFYFSPVHYSLCLYTALIEVGRLAPRALERFNQDGSTLEMIGAEHSPGVESTAGSLAQTLSVAAGAALARRLKGEPGRVWVFMTDGEFQEGQTWEALAAASHHGLGNLGAYVDVNGQQCDGAMAQVMGVEPLASRVSAFGARVREVDGHDLSALAAPAREPAGQSPLMVLARTDPCRGVEPLRARAPRLHYLRFRDAEERQAYQQLLEQMERDADD